MPPSLQGSFDHRMENLGPARRAQHNLHLLLADWKRGNWLMRYFLASQVGATALSMICSAGSIAMLATGNMAANLWLLCAAGISFIHAVSTFGVLKRRYQVRYAVW
ncbi:MAG TPA: hypothetical protein VHE37_07660 [Nevskiaceae bacterium]|nr:hypothetical protein [Nevskiaceae bacterium]